jgi:hypothetical protein
MFNFPDAPTVGLQFPPAPIVGQPTYTWDGEKWVLQSAPSIPLVPEAPNDGALYGRQAGAWQKGVKASGDTMTGTLIISDPSPVLVLNKPASGQQAYVVGENAGAARWAAFLGDSTAESGSNAGSNFQIDRYTDAGALIDAPFQINRATGRTTLTQAMVTQLFTTNQNNNIQGVWTVDTSTSAMAMGPNVGLTNLLPAGGGLVMIREGYHDGTQCLVWFTGSGFVIIHQTGTSWVLGSPAANQIQLAYTAPFYYANANLPGGLTTAWYQMWNVRLS